MKSVREKYKNGEISAGYVLDLLDVAMEELHGCLSANESISWMSGANLDGLDLEQEIKDLKEAIKNLENGKLDNSATH